MKLGEALSLRARLTQQLGDLSSRINTSALSQEGDAPAENAAELTVEYLRVSDDLARLVFKITVTNANTSIDGRMILELLQERETLIRERNLYRGTADAATRLGGLRFTRAEIKQVTHVDIAELRKLSEEVGEKVRVLDARIQQINWQTDLL